MVATCSVVKEGAEVGESRQLLPGNRSPGPRPRPILTWSGMASGGLSQHALRRLPSGFQDLTLRWDFSARPFPVVKRVTMPQVLLE